jgi:DNA-binding CsgD family transcriptional regulator
MTELTPRELEVTQMVARGLSTEQVARELIIGMATVRTHLYRVRTKLGVQDRAQLVSLAYRSGLMQAAGDGKSGPREDLRAG